MGECTCPKSLYIVVTVYSCRDTAGKQSLLAETKWERIKDVWYSLFKECGTFANVKGIFRYLLFMVEIRSQVSAWL